MNKQILRKVVRCCETELYEWMNIVYFDINLRTNLTATLIILGLKYQIGMFLLC